MPKKAVSMPNNLLTRVKILRSKNNLKDKITEVYLKEDPQELYFIVSNYFEKSFPDVVGTVSADISDYKKKEKENVELHFLPNDPEMVKDVENIYKAHKFVY